MKKIKLLLAVALCVGLTGCLKTFEDPQSAAVTAVAMAANTGTAIALKENPDWLPLFQSAHDKLGVFLATGSLTVAQLQSIMDELPIKELKSDTARIIIGNSEIFVDRYISGLTKIEKIAAIPVVGRALYDGMGKALPK